MSVAPPDEGKETLKAISMPKNIEDTELGNKEEPDDPKSKNWHTSRIWIPDRRKTV